MTHTSPSPEMLRIMASSDFRAAETLSEKVFCLREHKVTFATIAETLGVSKTTAKRWVKSGRTPRNRGRPTLRSPAQDHALQQAVLAAAKNHEPFSLKRLKAEV